MKKFSRLEKHKTGARPELFSPFFIDFSEPQKCQNLWLVGVSTCSYRILFAINLRGFAKKKTSYNLKFLSSQKTDLRDTEVRDIYQVLWPFSVR